ncbi:MAG: acyl-CoA dehydrogenase family protein, partial [Gammaproteobacteria bacterium]|nr:acyl-CoA dehydrogenase family protein [Gammaproteobacteria bacterium]
MLVVTRTADGGRCALVELPAAGLSCRPQPALAPAPLTSVTFEAVRVAYVDIDSRTLAELEHIGRFARTVRALGAAQRAFELAVDYAKVRRQFGQPIGRFQALQHKLADDHVALEAVALLVDAAGNALDSRREDWIMLAAAATAVAGSGLRQLSLDVQQVFGAVGFTEEHEAPLHLRRVFSDLAQLGGARRSRAALARMLFDDGQTFPELDLGSRAAALRIEVRRWLERNWDAAAKQRERARPVHQRGVDREFSRRLGARGWLGISWPTEYGGLGLTGAEHFAFAQELALAGAPVGAHSVAVDLVAPALIAFGSEAQKCDFLPRILRGELIFSLGYSEAEAGS